MSEEVTIKKRLYPFGAEIKRKVEEQKQTQNSGKKWKLINIHIQSDFLLPLVGGRIGITVSRQLQWH